MLVDLKPEIRTFVKTWQDKPEEQVREEVASYCQETNRIPDPYYFSITPRGELMSPVAKCKIKDVVERNTLVGELEYQALEKIERWAGENNEGVIAWISPPALGAYTTSKVIVSEIKEQDGAKILFNRAIVLDLSEEECHKFAQDLTNFSTNKPLLSSLEEIRSNPLILRSDKHWTYVLEDLIPDLSLKCVRQGEDLKIKKEVLFQAQEIYDDLFRKTGQVDMSQMINRVSGIGMIGEYSTSCPVVFRAAATTFRVFLSGSFFIENAEWFCKSCPLCKKEINAVVKPGEKCPNCSAERQCA